MNIVHDLGSVILDIEAKNENQFVLTLANHVNCVVGRDNLELLRRKLILGVKYASTPL